MRVSLSLSLLCLFVSVCLSVCVCVLCCVSLECVGVCLICLARLGVALLSLALHLEAHTYFAPALLHRRGCIVIEESEALMMVHS